MSNLTEWAKAELDRLLKNNDGDTDGLEMQKAMNEDVLQVVEIFAGQGHSGFSASYALSLISRLLSWKPITPLTGEDDEWGPVEEWDEGNKMQQNKRCSSIFRYNYDNSTAHQVDAKVFSDDKGESWYTSGDSSVPVTFPYDVPSQPERIILNDDGTHGP